MKKYNNKVFTSEGLVSAYNKLEVASITWSRKDKGMNLYDKYLTLDTAKLLDEYLIFSKKKGVGPSQITIDKFKGINVTYEERRYFDLPWLDGYYREFPWDYGHISIKILIKNMMMMMSQLILGGKLK